MSVIGPLITIAGCSGLLTLNESSSLATVGGLLFVAGFGIGLFNSPNSMSNMLSVLPSQRGVASAVGMLTLMFSSMVALVITFSLVLNSIPQQELFILFIYGGTFLPKSDVLSVIDALKINYYLLIVLCALGSMFAALNNFKTGASKNNEEGQEKNIEKMQNDEAHSDSHLDEEEKQQPRFSLGDVAQNMPDAPTRRLSDVL